MAREISLADHRRRRSQIGAYIEHTRELLGRSAEAGAVFGFLSVLIFFIIATAIHSGWPPQIIDGRSLASIATNATSQGIIAVGVTILMISGEFDLSVGSILGLSALVFIIAADSGLGGLAEMFLSRQRIEELGISYSGLPGLVAIGIAMATGAALGLVNGLLLIWTRIPSFIITLGTLYIYRSMMLNIIPGGTIARYTREPMVWYIHPLVIALLALVGLVFLLFISFPTLKVNWWRVRSERRGTFSAALRLVALGAVLLISLAVVVRIGYDYTIDRGLFSDTGEYFSKGNLVEAPFFDVLNGQLAFVKDNFRASIVWWFLIAAIFAVVLNQTRYGNSVFAAGGNPQAARAQGVNVNRVKVLNFVLSGTLAAVAGIMEGARFKVVEPLRGTGYELDVIAATVIGGTLLSGGYGSIGGTILGVLLAFMLKTGLVLIGVEADWFRGVLGLIMIGAVIINTNIRRQR